MMKVTRPSNFVARQRLAQGGYLRGAHPEHAGHAGADYRLAARDFELNLAPAIRVAADAYFKKYGITWHRHASHGLSSQVCCLNFLMPLAERPEVLSRLIGHVLGIPAPRMIAVEDGPDGRPWFVGFEWIGRQDYLNESAPGRVRTRGANATSADAIVRFENDGRLETLLIEWKYTETYGAPISASGNPTRIQRYRDLAFAPAGPIAADRGVSLEDFFYEPFYQLLRQQMLAKRMQAAREDDAQRVRVLHISPTGNRKLHAVTSKNLQRFGDDAFDVFAKLLVDPDAFISRSTEAVFGAVIAELNGDPWAQYLSERYGFLTEVDAA